MADILIYTKSGCPYCARAKQLLSAKGAEYKEIDLLRHPDKREEMIAGAGGRTTVPQVFIHGKHIGGSDDLYDLESQGKLDTLLKAA